MKNLTFSILLFTLSVLTISCEKDPEMPEHYPETPGQDESYETISINLKANEFYEMDFGQVGDEDALEIVTQASHFKISEVERDSSTEWEAVYRYQAKSGFTGSDKVVLKASTGSDGASPPTKIEYTTIEFNISEPSCVFQGVELLPTEDIAELFNPYDTYWIL